MGVRFPPGALSSRSMGDDLIPENYNSKDLVNMWREFIDWNKRRAGEGNFLVSQFKKHQVKKILDASLGDGCDSIYLIQQGYDVISNEVDKTFLSEALKNAKKENVELTVTALDWRKLDSEFSEESFDAVILLGNSLTYLFTEKSRLQTLRQFRKLLRKGGILVIDERNYQYILDNRDKILKGEFRYSGEYVYCGETVHGIPVDITDRSVKFEYTNDRTRSKGYVTMYPFKWGEMEQLLVRSGFQSIEQFSDYSVGKKSDADFYQYVCVR